MHPWFVCGKSIENTRECRADVILTTNWLDLRSTAMGNGYRRERSVPQRKACFKRQPMVGGLANRGITM